MVSNFILYKNVFAVLRQCRWTASGGVAREIKKLEAAKKVKEEMDNMNKRQYN
jgi:hypothetical protein